MRRVSAPTTDAAASRRAASCLLPKAGWLVALALTLLSTGAVAQTAVDFAPSSSPQPVGQATVSQSVSVQDTLSGSEQVAAVKVLTQGVLGLDFADAGGGKCDLDPNLLQTQSCTVNVTFNPTAPGLREGAVVLLDSSNNVIGTTYIYGYGSGPLGVFTPGTITTAAGSGIYTVYNDGVPSTSGDLDQPSAVAIDGAGNLYIADSEHNVIRKVTPAGGSLANGTMVTIAGDSSPGYSGDNGQAISALLNDPRGLAIDGAGNLYIADTGNNVVRKINAVTQVITTIAGTGTPGMGSNGAATSEALNAPQGVAVDARGNIYIADTGNSVVREINAQTGLMTIVAGTGAAGYDQDNVPATTAKLNHPLAVALDGNGNIYIADSQNNRVREVNASTGTITTFAGSGSVDYLADGGNGGDGGPATSAVLYTPSGLAFDAAGNLYISDTQDERIRKVYAVGPQAGDIVTAAGNGQLDFTGDGASATQAAVYDPLGLTIDKAGNLYIAAALNQRVREVYSTPAELTLDTADYPNGVRITQMSSPIAQAIENDGNAALNISSITHDSNAAIDSSTTTCAAGTSLSLGATCNIGAEFAPTGTATGTETGNITIDDNASNTPQVIGITGKAAAINSTNTTVLPDKNPAVVGTTVTFSISVTSGASTGTPNGTVTIYDNGNSIGFGQLDANGDYSFQTDRLTVGMHPITVAYSGDTVHEKSTSQVLNEVIQPNTQIAITSSTPGNTAVVGTNVTFTATFSGEGANPVPTGTVTFFAAGAGYTNTQTATIGPSGTASVSIDNLPVGDDQISVSYAGDSNNPSSSASLNENITAIKTVTQVAASTTTPTYGSDVILTATITPTPTGVTSGSQPETVAFYTGGCSTTLIGNGTVRSGQAAITTDVLPAGTDTVCAEYSGDSLDASSQGTIILNVSRIQPSMTLAASPASPSLAGTPLTFTAKLTGASTPPSGTVSFTANGNALGTASIVNGMATLTNATLQPGTYTITGTYQGDNNNLGTTATTQYVSNEASTATVITPNPASGIAGNPVTLVARVTVTASSGATGSGGTPTGTIQFYNGNTPLGAAQKLVNGIATFATPAFDPGTYTITAQYSGDASDSSSTSAADVLKVVQAQTSIALTSSATNNTSLATQAVTFTATVKNQQGSAVPSGVVTFYDGTTQLGVGAINADGVATFPTTSLAVGTHSIVAEYAGNTDTTASTSNTISEVVDPIPTTLTLGTSLSTANTAQQVILVATVAGDPAQPIPAGTVTYMNGTTTLGTGTVNSSGVATFSPVLNPGTYSLTAEYTPSDGIHSASTAAAIKLTITPGNGFIFNPDSSTFSLVSGQNKTLSVTLQSNDNFTDTIDFGCADLPAGVTCEFSKPSVALAANGTVTEQITIDTASPLSSGTQASLDRGSGSGTVLAGIFLPIGLVFGLIFLRSRKRHAALFTVALLIVLAGTTFMVTGCGGVSFTGASPGTYTFQIVGTGQNTQVTRDMNVTMTVTK